MQKAAFSTNQHLSSKEFWKLTTADKKDTLNDLVYFTLESMRMISIYLQPLSPNQTGKVLKFMAEASRLTDAQIREQ